MQWALHFLWCLWKWVFMFHVSTTWNPCYGEWAVVKHVSHTVSNISEVPSLCCHPWPCASLLLLKIKDGALLHDRAKLKSIKQYLPFSSIHLELLPFRGWTRSVKLYIFLIIDRHCSWMSLQTLKRAQVQWAEWLCTDCSTQTLSMWMGTDLLMVHSDYSSWETVVCFSNCGDTCHYKISKCIACFAQKSMSYVYIIWYNCSKYFFPQKWLYKVNQIFIFFISWR